MLTLLIDDDDDDRAAVRPDLPVVGTLVHGTAPRELADTLTLAAGWLSARHRANVRGLSPLRTSRSVLATGGASLMNDQHRSPTR